MEVETMGVQSIDAEDDQFAYRYDTQLLIDRRDEDLDEDAISEYITEHYEGNSIPIPTNHGKCWLTATPSVRSTISSSKI
mgnify:CR=1 FL=1